MEQSQHQLSIKKVVADRSARSLTVVSLLAVAPVALFALGRSMLAVVAVVNVGLITGSLYLLTSPTEGGHHDGDHGDDETTGVDDREETVETDDATV